MVRGKEKDSRLVVGIHLVAGGIHRRTPAAGIHPAAGGRLRSTFKGKEIE